MSHAEVVHDTAEAVASLAAARAHGRTIGFVPTMGALHDGHLSLVRLAASECDLVVVSIFVNPLQFGPSEDFTSYPRTLDADVAKAESAGARLVVAPSVEGMYPGWPAPVLTAVRVAELTEPMEGAVRPGHFDGVTTVVAKLLHLVGPCRAYFGQKDWQQLRVVRQMVSDLLLPVVVVGCPTVREPDGLALSSRNAYLSPDERAKAPVLHRGLQAGVDAIQDGERRPSAVRDIVREVIEPWATPDYVEVVDAATLRRIDPLAGEVRLLVAARFGGARLIDNLGVVVPT